MRVTKHGEVRESVIGGRDIYAVSAPLVVEAAMRLLGDTETLHGGVRSPGDVFDATDFLASLSDVLEPLYVER